MSLTVAIEVVDVLRESEEDELFRVRVLGVLAEGSSWIATGLVFLLSLSFLVVLFSVTEAALASDEYSLDETD